MPESKEIISTQFVQYKRQVHHSGEDKRKGKVVTLYSDGSKQIVSHVFRRDYFSNLQK